MYLPSYDSMTDSRRELRAVSLKQMTAQTNSGIIVDFLPEAYTLVIVHCEEFECLGYLDNKGIWRNQFTSKPVENRVVGWSVF